MYCMNNRVNNCVKHCEELSEIDTESVNKQDFKMESKKLQKVLLLPISTNIKGDFFKLKLLQRLKSRKHIAYYGLKYKNIISENICSNTYT